MDDIELLTYQTRLGHDFMVQADAECTIMHSRGAQTIIAPSNFISEKFYFFIEGRKQPRNMCVIKLGCYVCDKCPVRVFMSGSAHFSYRVALESLSLAFATNGPCGNQISDLLIMSHIVLYPLHKRDSFSLKYAVEIIKGLKQQQFNSQPLINECMQCILTINSCCSFIDVSLW